MTQQQHNDFPCLFEHGDIVVSNDGKRMIFDDVKRVGNKRYYTFFYVDSYGDIMTRRSEHEHVNRFVKIGINDAEKLDTFKQLFEVLL